MSLVRVLACAALLAAVLPAQVPAGQRAATGSETNLHAAWLSELLDLDTAAAARTYAAVTIDNKAQKGRRFVALARLLELQRIGAVEPVSLGFEYLELPPELLEARDRLAVAPQLAAVRRPFDRLVEEAKANPQGLAIFIEQGERGLYNQRTLVPQIYRRAVTSADSSTGERHRQLRLQLEEAQRRNDRQKIMEVQGQMRQLRPIEDEYKVLQRSRALALLKIEVSDVDSEKIRKLRADHLRAQWFSFDQRIPLPPGTPEEVLALVRANLEQLRNGQDLQQQDEAEALKKLQAQLDRDAASKGAAQALQELNRLPVYNRLLLRPR